MILEGIVTTVSADDVLNIAPMGPRVDGSMKQLHLRLFAGSQTRRNLKAVGAGVFHVIDDVLLLAQSAVGRIDPPPPTMPATAIRGHILVDACRFYEFRVGGWDDDAERAEIEATVVASGRLRDFFGFNRAKHAVVEAAILATRVHLLPPADIAAEMARLKPWVEKTGGPREREAFQFLHDYLTQTGGGKA